MNPAGCDRLLEEGDIFSLRPGNFGGTLSWYASPRGDALHTDGLQAADAEWVLERCARQKDRPFFLALGFFRPHTPYVSPASYFEGYPPAQMPLVKGWEEENQDKPEAALASRKKEQEDLTDPLRREAVQAYFASITFMDAQLGKVLNALDRLGLAEDTIVVFTSDHGYHLGEHGLWQKMSLFEESARVPLIIAAPGQARQGAVVEEPVGLIDLYPTLTQLCGVQAPESLQGQDLTPLLKDATAKGRGWTLSMVMRGKGGESFRGYTLRTPRWRYTEWDEGRAGRELYDHQADPLEHVNLAEHADYADQVAKLSQQLQAAIPATFPADGQVPEVKKGSLWSPNLTEP